MDRRAHGAVGAAVRAARAGPISVRSRTRADLGRDPGPGPGLGHGNPTDRDP